MLTACDDDAASVAAVLAGTAGYVLKDIRGQSLADAIHRVHRGETLVSRAVIDRVVHLPDTAHRDQTPALPSDLTTRERQVLGFIGEGMTNRQIGERLGLAEKTVKNYVSGVLSKLGMERRTQAPLYAAAQGAAASGHQRS